MLEFINVSKKYHIRGNESREILKSASFIINKNETTAILGESGVGKTTLLNLIAGFDKFDNGSIKYKGKEIKKYKKYWTKNIISVIFQDFNLIDHLTVYENIEIALNQYKISRKDKKLRIEKVINELNIRHIKNVKAKLLSGGEKQRVAIARALVKNPDIILADEPTGSLDESNKEIITNLLLSMAKDGKTVIIVTHSKELADKCDRVLEVKNKQVIELSNKNNTSLFNLEYPGAKLKNKNLVPIKLSFKNFFQKKIRMLSVAMGTSIGLVAAILIMGITNGVEQNILKDANDLARPDVVMVYKIGDDIEDIYSNEITYEGIEKIYKIANVERVIPEYNINLDIILPTFTNDTNDISTLQKIDIMYHGKYNVTISNEKLLFGSLPIKEKEIAINKKDAEKYLTLMKQEVSDTNLYTLIGKEIDVQIYVYDMYDRKIQNNINEEVIIDTDFKILKDKLKITGILKDSYLVLNGMLSVISEDLANKSIKELGKEKISTSKLTIFVNDEKNVQSVMSEINKLGYHAERQEELIRDITDVISGVSQVLVSLTLISLFVSAIMIAIIMYINLLERRREIAILHSIGYTKFNIKTIFYLEGIMLGVTSLIIAILLSQLLSNLFTPIVKEMFDGASIIYTTDMYVSITLIGLFVSIISIILPLEITLRKNISNVLKNY